MGHKKAQNAQKAQVFSEHFAPFED